jgi:hypothetical protein
MAPAARQPRAAGHGLRARNGELVTWLPRAAPRPVLSTTTSASCSPRNVKAIYLESPAQPPDRRLRRGGRAQVAAMVEPAVATYGRLDMAFNNAGIIGPAGDLADESARHGLGVRIGRACVSRPPWRFHVHAGARPPPACRRSCAHRPTRCGSGRADPSGPPRERSRSVRDARSTRTPRRLGLRAGRSYPSPSTGVAASVLPRAPHGQARGVLMIGRDRSRRRELMRE